MKDGLERTKAPPVGQDQTLCCQSLFRPIDGKMVWGEYKPKPFADEDVDIEVECCGICGSDLHTLRSDWGPSNYPVVVGHEVVGKVARVGKDVKHVK